MSEDLGRIRVILKCAGVAVLLLGAPGALSAGHLSGDTAPQLAGTALIKEMQKGGYVISSRHGSTSDLGEKAVLDADLEDCGRQRNRSDAGMTQTKELGAAFKARRIPAGEVYASPYCRCLETG